MVTRKDLLAAYKIVAQGQVLPQNATVSQIVGSLIVYKSRGEFDGSLQSAIECLEQACYEIEPKQTA